MGTIQKTKWSRVGIILSDEELEHLKSVAHKECLTPHEYLKKMVHSDLKLKIEYKQNSKEELRSCIWICLSEDEDNKLTIIAKNEGIEKDDLVKNIIVQTIKYD